MELVKAALWINLQGGRAGPIGTRSRQIPTSQSTYAKPGMRGRIPARDARAAKMAAMQRTCNARKRWQPGRP